MFKSFLCKAVTKMYTRALNQLKFSIKHLFCSQTQIDFDWICRIFCHLQQQYQFLRVKWINDAEFHPQSSRAFPCHLHHIVKAASDWPWRRRTERTLLKMWILPAALCAASTNFSPGLGQCRGALLYGILISVSIYDLGNCIFGGNTADLVDYVSFGS